MLIIQDLKNWNIYKITGKKAVWGGGLELCTWAVDMNGGFERCTWVVVMSGRLESRKRMSKCEKGSEMWEDTGV
jgi:hypothetical protein